MTNNKDMTKMAKKSNMKRKKPEVTHNNEIRKNKSKGVIRGIE
ncbi:hypothetical protein CLTEP_10430 [Clostridium tepidiprofundi DSM 19306]|uniref:Uncharacterized protein n=1 Tax=Clostridium tepidiprofundi DSM 19306 TaxID=1121338 RepID=A0A151B5G7_9CLOT|nr:hypothetical protein [Clostridium tepidiprofundi]KYH35050.1 hypothetical protein CLTEP_10430 [Clostridium tepidiprofundi DSM 19306]